MNVNLFSGDDDFLDQAVCHGLPLFKRKSFEIITQQSAKGLGVVNDLLPMRRHNECGAEKNRTLIHHDISMALKKLFDEVKNEKVRETGLALIETDPKYRKKYTPLWKGK